MKLSDQKRATHLAFVDSVGENAYDVEEIAKELILLLYELYPEQFLNYYNLSNITKLPTLEEIAIARNFKSSGNAPDVLRCAQRILTDFRTGKIGRITIENTPKYKVTSTENFR